MLRKHWHVEEGPNCVLCDRDVREDIDHLLFDYDFAKACWQEIGLSWDLSKCRRDRLLQMASMYPHTNFFEIFASVAWNIWKQRNGYIFEEREPTMDSWWRSAKKRSSFVSIQGQELPSSEAAWFYRVFFPLALCFAVFQFSCVALFRPVSSSWVILLWPSSFPFLCSPQ